MAGELNSVQESIKLALDAADAATDVTSEYSQVKREHKKLEKKVSQIHRYTTITFVSAISAAVIALAFSATLYFKSISELKSDALSSLSENWGVSVGACLVFFIINLALGLVPLIGSLVQLILTGALSVGFSHFFLKSLIFKAISIFHFIRTLRNGKPSLMVKVSLNST